MAKSKVINHIGITVFFFDPKPNCRNDPSFSYKNAGSTNCIKQNNAKNNMIDTDVIFLRIYCLNIIDIYILV